jgi:conjugal transfer pilus assembly protein TraV
MKLAFPSARCRLVALLAGTTLLGLNGCASTLSGVGGTATYACQAPVGAQCTSVSGVYANAGQGARQLLGSQQPRPVASGALGAAPTGSAITAPAPSSAVAPAALRTAPRVLRLWIAPWEDSDGDLHEASTVHVLIDHGRWLMERVRPAPRGPRMGVTPPTTVSTGPTNTPPAGQTQTNSPTTNPTLDQTEP